MLQTHFTDAERRLNPLSPEQIEAQKKSRNILAVKIAAGTLAVSLFATGAFLAGKLSGGKNNPENNNVAPITTETLVTTESSSPEPTETPIVAIAETTASTKTAEATAETTAPAEIATPVATTPEATTTTSPEVAFEENGIAINAELMKNPEELMKTFIDGRLTDWENAGATPENAKIFMDNLLNPANNKVPGDTLMLDHITKLANETDPKYINSLLVDNWESNPALVEFVQKSKDAHLAILNYNLITSFNDIDPKDVEPYKKSTKLDKITDSYLSDDGNTLIITAYVSLSDNSDKNRVGEDASNFKPIIDTASHPIKLWFVKENGVVKLSNFIPNTSN